MQRVITNAGFELVSEALSAGKKILIKPLAGQIGTAFKCKGYCNAFSRSCYEEA
jgi:hypothetical protein